MHFASRATLAALSLFVAAACGDSATDAAAVPDAATTGPLPTDVGQPAPAWSATDFQPQSPRFNQAYGLDQYRGKVLFVGFLSGWCPYCQAQAERLQTLQNELIAEGVTDVQIVVVNSTDALKDQATFVQLASFPLFQDSDDALVFRQHRAAKDDLAVYDKSGNLLHFYGKASDRDLQEPATYAAVKAELLGAR